MLTKEVQDEICKQLKPLVDERYVPVAGIIATIRNLVEDNDIDGIREINAVTLRISERKYREWEEIEMWLEGELRKAATELVFFGTVAPEEEKI